MADGIPVLGVFVGAMAVVVIFVGAISVGAISVGAKYFSPLVFHFFDNHSPKFNYPMHMVGHNNKFIQY